MVGFSFPVRAKWKHPFGRASREALRVTKSSTSQCCTSSIKFCFFDGNVRIQSSLAAPSIPLISQTEQPQGSRPALCAVAAGQRRL